MAPSPPPGPEGAPALLPSDWRVGVWRSFLRAHAAVVQRLERELLTEVGLPLPWYDVLLQLMEAPGGRLRMAELADQVLLSRSGLTRLIDRLQAEGLVRRERSKDDARGTFTVITDAGKARLRAASPSHLTSIYREWVQHFDDEELQVLGRLLSRFPSPAGE